LKILFVGPEICSPWSEGRKVFVRDLVENLQAQHQVSVLTTVPVGETTNFDVPYSAFSSRWRLEVLYKIVKELPSHIDKYNPDVICHFPYATFRNIYGLVNKSYMKLVDNICKKNGVPCISVMYSVDGHVALQDLEKKVGCLALGSSEKWSGNIIEPGLRFTHWPEIKPKQNKSPTILFMAGMWQIGTKRVDFVLKTRGLATLLEAGQHLKDKGIKLIIASPLFADDRCREYLLNSKYNTWDQENIIIETIVNIPDIYACADLFIFPFTENKQHFVPTSVVESMSAETPVIISDLPLFKGMIDDGVTGYMFQSENPVSLAQKIEEAFSDYEKLNNMGIAARDQARERWSIDNSAKQLLKLAEQIV
jgi:glycosyltransferase involved in cell wall biosynthesis